MATTQNSRNGYVNRGYVTNDLQQIVQPQRTTKIKTAPKVKWAPSLWMILASVVFVLLVLLVILLFIFLWKTKTPEEDSCKPKQYKCKVSGKCIYERFLCDGINDCDFGEDEDQEFCVKCNENEFKCLTSKTCVKLSSRCDGTMNCEDYSDEHQCLSISKENIVEGTFEGQTNIPVCYDDFKDDFGNIICRMNGYEMMIEATNSSLSSSTLLSIKSFSDSAAPIIYSKKSNYCSGQVRINCTSYKCGKRSPNLSNFGNYILNGEDATNGAWPWFVFLQLGNRFCGGTIINNQWILTAAHCLKESDKLLKINDVKTFADIPSLERDSGISIETEKLIIHENYEAFFSSNDIGLVKLKTPLVYNDYILPICLPDISETIEVNLKYRLCVSIGYGNVGQNQFPKTLQQARMHLFSESLCNLMIQDNPSTNVSNSRICSGTEFSEGQTNICFGDSGGPLSCLDENNRWFVVGIHSFTFSPQNFKSGNVRACQMGAVTKVASYINWINDKISNN